VGGSVKGGERGGRREKTRLVVGEGGRAEGVKRCWGGEVKRGAEIGE